MDADYLRASECDLTKNQEDCCICYKPGRHQECSDIYVKREAQIKKDIEKNKERELKADIEFLAKYSITGAYIDETKLNQSYDKIKKYLNSKVGVSGHHYYEGKGFENDEWWYLPYGFIGCVGYIVEKDSLKIFCLGSGYAMKRVNEINGANLLWGGVLAYVDGEVDA